MPVPVFQLMFPSDKTEYWARQYPPKWDDDALEAGREIREGDYSRSNLEKIVAWKSERRLKLIGDNPGSEISDALRLAAVHAHEPRSAFAVLMGLRGVAVPMASAILTAIDQEKYTLVDWGAVEALGVPDADYYNLNFYLKYYFPECKRLAAEANVSLRTLDRALWAGRKPRGKIDPNRGLQKLPCAGSASEISSTNPSTARTRLISFSVDLLAEC
jgi:hypothetical protein